MIDFREGTEGSSPSNASSRASSIPLRSISLRAVAFLTDASSRTSSIPLRSISLRAVAFLTDASSRTSSIPLRSISLRAVALWEYKRAQGKNKFPPCALLHPRTARCCFMLFHKVHRVDRFSVFQDSKVEIGSFYTVIFGRLVQDSDGFSGCHIIACC